MPVTKHLKQNIHSATVPRELLIAAYENEDFSKKDLRVLLLMMSKLEGWSGSNTKSPDPNNYVKIEAKAIAESLNIDKKDVKHAIEKILDMGFIEEGSTNSIKHGYRFRF